jgi:hypothetical protein
MIEREQTQKDELLKKKFPHIFLEYQDSIREFWRGIKEKEKYYHESSHSAIGYPEFGKEVDWVDINLKLRGKIGYIDPKIRKPNTTKEMVEKMGGKEIAKKWWALEKIEKLQKEILEKEVKQREITNEELSYILFMFWKEILEEEARNGISDDEFALSLYRGWLEEYFKWFPKKEEKLI